MAANYDNYGFFRICCDSLLFYSYHSTIPKKPSSGSLIPLYEAIIEAITLLGEVVVDNFAGGGNLGKACLYKGRLAILYEILKEKVDRINARLQAFQLSSGVYNELSKSACNETSKKMSQSIYSTPSTYSTCLGKNGQVTFVL